ncbi:MAG TPA: hypothetical protein VEK33_17080 [Terriglobales bacterium]|nr:hypothetical protein [Terriglobales bacterium]
MFHRSKLYRNLPCLVICGLLIPALAQLPFGQPSSGSKTNKGPRALGLLELSPNGKSHLIPITILYDGKFYDASAYKASPVPMALWAETEYEGLRSGISQGLFTVTAALQNQRTNEWIAEGTWQTAESLAAKHTKKSVASVPRGLNQDEGPPVLRHSGANPKPPQPTSSEPAPASPPPAPATPPAAPAASPSVPAPPPPASASASSAPPAPASEPEDPNRPVLKRGKPEPAPPEPLSPSNAAAPKPAVHASLPNGSQVQLIPAISDADGPEPHPYTYELKGEQAETCRKKMLALAADEVRARAKQLTGGMAGSTVPARTSGQRAPGATKPAQPDLDDVQLNAFDLSSSNEPIMVLTASSQMPPHMNERPPKYFVTLVARQDINGDFHKIFSSVTDSQHLDVEPKFELIDAVDVDGDGRGELLFRKVYDASSAYVVYRVIGDQVYALFDGTPLS